jgi:hypothetical protein
MRFAIAILQTGAESVSTRFCPFWPFTILEAASIFRRLETKIGHAQSTPLPSTAGLI